MSEALRVSANDATDALVAAFKSDAGSTTSAYILSGYPRNTADLLNYLDRLERVDGVILINWHDEAIKAQIEYGAKEGQIQLEAAKAELRHYKKHVISVAQYFDFKQLLYVVGNLWQSPPTRTVE